MSYGTLYFFEMLRLEMIFIILIMLGMIIGGCIGVFAICLCVAAGKADENRY